MHVVLSLWVSGTVVGLMTGLCDKTNDHSIMLTTKVQPLIKTDSNSQRNDSVTLSGIESTESSSLWNSLSWNRLERRGHTKYQMKNSWVSEVRLRSYRVWPYPCAENICFIYSKDLPSTGLNFILFFIGYDLQQTATTDSNNRQQQQTHYHS